MDKIAMKEIPQTGKFGHFSPDGLEYVTTRPDTPRPFDNFIWNKSIIANIQQTGVGYTDYQIGTNEMTKLSTGIGRICDFDVFGRDTFMNRLIYIRDNETGKFWNVGFHSSVPLHLRWIIGIIKPPLNRTFVCKAEIKH